MGVGGHNGDGCVLTSTLCTYDLLPNLRNTNHALQLLG